MLGGRQYSIDNPEKRLKRKEDVGKKKIKEKRRTTISSTTVTTVPTTSTTTTITVSFCVYVV